MRFKLPSFTIATAPAAPALGLESNREWIAVTIRHRPSGAEISFPVGSPVYGDFDEVKAARSAISFASTWYCHEGAEEQEFARLYGEALTNEAFCHRTLGVEMRRGF